MTEMSDFWTFYARLKNHNLPLFRILSVYEMNYVPYKEWNVSSRFRTLGPDRRRLERGP